MRYRLALDIGTASIGLVAYQLDEQSDPIDIPYHAVRIFQEPLNRGKGVCEPKQASRRSARQQRRQFERKANRLRRIAHCLPLLGIRPEELPPDAGQHIHHWRAQAASHRIELEDFARVLLKMAKRRGYYGGFRADKKVQDNEAKPAKPRSGRAGQEEKTAKPDEIGVVKNGIDKLKAEVASCGAETLGQYLARRFERKDTLKLKEAGLYAHRDMLEAEFEHIWATQAQHHTILNASHKGRPIKAIFHDALFFQRPLKSPAPMVGNCQLEKGLPRAPMAQPAAQAFRIEKQLADLRWGMGRNTTDLLPEQKAVIRQLLGAQENVPFNAIYTALEKAGCPKPAHRGLNMERASREELAGDKTRAAWRGKKIDLLGDWDRLDPKTKIQIIHFLADLGSPEQIQAPDWPSQFHKEARQFSEDFKTFIDQLKSRAGYGRLAAMGFDAGRSSYSVEALEKLTRIMREENLDEHAAVEKAYPDHHAPTEPQTRLPPPPATGNTVVDVALRQVEKEVRKTIKHLGAPPAEIYIELAREMALGVSRRNEIESENARNKKRRQNAAHTLQALQLAASKTNVLKYLLWEEQEHHCPYCDRSMGITEVADGRETHIEHILPRSLTRVGRKRDQLVLAHAVCNHDKGDSTPWDAWGGEPPKNPERWRSVLAQAERFRSKKLLGKARLLLLQDWESDDNIQDFSDRQFQETAWIAKHTAQWLRTICPPSKLWVSRGEMTAYLRRIWHLETVIPQARFDASLPVFDTDGQRISREDFDRHRALWEGRDKLACAERTDRRIDKRKDHRHHLIDALVIGLCTPPLYRRMASEWKRRAERKHQGERVNITLAASPPLPGLRNRALALVQNCNLSHKPDRYPDGALFKATAYGIAEVSQDGEQVRMRLKPEELSAGAADQTCQRFLTLRVKLKDLAEDQNKKPLSLEKVRKALNDIASPDVRRIVLDTFEASIAKGKSPREALTGIIHPQYGTPIKAVKIKYGNADEAYTVIHESRGGLHYKLLPHEGYAYLDVWTTEKGMDARLVRPRDAMRQKHQKGTEGVARFHKNDTVRNDIDSRVYLIRQIKARSGGLLVLTPLTEAREVREMNAAEGLRTLSGKALLKLRRV